MIKPYLLLRGYYERHLNIYHNNLNKIPGSYVLNRINQLVKQRGFNYADANKVDAERM